MYNKNDAQPPLHYLNKFHDRKISRANGDHLSLMSDLVELFGIDLGEFEFIQIAGSCGKGSTAEIVSSLLNAHQIKHGLYTGPHLIQYEERFKIMGTPISRPELLQLVQRIEKKLSVYPREEDVGHTHIMFLIALLFFRNHRIRLVIFENGVGGWSDPSNIFNPVISAITEIALDHTHLLGSSIEEITKDKMKIFKEDTDYAVCGTRNERAQRVLQNAIGNRKTIFRFIDRDYHARILSGDSNGSIFEYEGHVLSLKNLHLSAPGEHQVQNASTALALAECLMGIGYSLEPEKIKFALESLYIPCRMEKFVSGPATFLLDAAHNGHELKTLRRQIQKQNIEISQVLLSFSSNKNIGQMIHWLNPPEGCKILVVPNPFSERRVPTEDIEHHLNTAGLHYQFYPDIESALDSIHRTQNPGTQLVTGSMYLVGAVKHLLIQSEYKCSTE